MTRENARKLLKLLPLVQAHADGKIIQVYSKFRDRWDDLTDPKFHCEPGKYRIKPEPEPPVMVPLGPEDFPPGSVIRQSDWPKGVYAAPTEVGRTGLCFGMACPSYSWEELMQKNFKVKRPGEDWQPCCKPDPSTPTPPES